MQTVTFSGIQRIQKRIFKFHAKPQSTLKKTNVIFPWPSANASHFNFWIHPNQKSKLFYFWQFFASWRLSVRNAFGCSRHSVSDLCPSVKICGQFRVVNGELRKPIVSRKAAKHAEKGKYRHHAKPQSSQIKAFLLASGQCKPFQFLDLAKSEIEISVFFAVLCAFAPPRETSFWLFLSVTA